jgi:hypothetical protein
MQPSSVDGESFLVVETAPFANPGLASGASGHGRIYGPRRPLAFVLFGIPILQLIDYRTWFVWG